MAASLRRHPNPGSDCDRHGNSDCDRRCKSHGIPHRHGNNYSSLQFDAVCEPDGIRECDTYRDPGFAAG
jgi:hypothetical protein